MTDAKSEGLCELAGLAQTIEHARKLCERNSVLRCAPLTLDRIGRDLDAAARKIRDIDISFDAPAHVQPITDAAAERFCEICEHAKGRPFAERLSLIRCLETLGGFASAKRPVLYGVDFAPLSLSWAIDGGGIHGGMIYHGPHDGNGSGSAPTFSVTLDNATGWRIHT